MKQLQTVPSTAPEPDEIAKRLFTFAMLGVFAIIGVILGLMMIAAE